MTVLDGGGSYRLWTHAAPVYRFDELGFAQFERVCDEVLAAEGLAGLEWVGRADTVRTAFAPTVPASVAGRELRGRTVVIASVWSRAAEWAEAGELVRAFGELEADPEQPLVVLSNRDRTSAGNTVWIGPARLAELIDAHPSVRRRVPSLLGIRDIADGALEPTWDRNAAHALSRVFIPTRAYRAALDVLERHHFAVLIGPPEMGKTAIARTLALALELEGWEIHECIRPGQVWDAFAHDRPQLFIADDAFGSTEYRPDAAEHWAIELDRILQAMDERHWLVWTSRPAPLKAGLGRIRREHGVERFPRPAEVGVDAAHLDIEEKASILYRHTRAAELPRNASGIVRRHGAMIVRHQHFTPERISRFVRTRLPLMADAQHIPMLALAISQEIAEPTTAMEVSLDALSPEHRALLVALLDTPAGPVPERELASATRRHAAEGLPRPPGELVDRLTDHFVRVIPPHSVTWVHPSWRDLVIDRLAADQDARHRFLERCSIEGALLALSRAGGPTGERLRPLIGADADWDALAERLHELVPELADTEIVRLLTVLIDLVSVRDDHAAELEAVSATVLRRLAGCWEDGTTIAGETVLELWHRLAVWMPRWEQLRVPTVLQMWQQPPRTQPPAELAFLDVPRFTSESDEGSDSAIVARILADL